MRPNTLLLLLVLLVVTAGRLWLSGQVELSEDEAYYWVWSLHPALGYLDHPPGIAALIGLGTIVFGDTEVGVRLLSVLLGTVTVGLGLSLVDRHRSTLAMALLSMPLLSLGGLLATPDVPLVACWALGLWAAAKERWWLLGLAAGLAMLSKYTGLLLLPLVLAARPADLKTRGPWLAAALALLVYLPNALWNLAHDGLSWRFQLDHVAEGGSGLELLLAQVGLAGPLLFVGLVLGWTVGLKGDRVARLCWTTSLPLLLLAVLSGGEANWAAPALFSATVGLARSAATRPRFARVMAAGAGVNLLLSGALLLQLLHPIADLPIDPRDRLSGGRTLGQSVAAWGEASVWTARYQEAALIHFYGGVEARAWPGLGRPDQYDLWESPLPERGLFVRVWRANARLALDDLGYERGAPNVVSAAVSTTDPTGHRPVARWQVYEFWTPR